jgi:tetraacyldisaccharide-1-P 4'-kinase
VTTEKDLVRLRPELQRRLESAAPVRAAKLSVRLRDESAAIYQLLALLPANGGERMGKLQQIP